MSEAEEIAWQLHALWRLRVDYGHPNTEDGARTFVKQQCPNTSEQMIDNISEVLVLL